jgi:NADH:ubiquinone reductase (H+-translocating)
MTDGFSDPARRPKVVIVGGGFGGLEAAKGLARSPVQITLLDRQNHHCFQPLLYQVATAALSPADVAWPIRSVLRDQTNTEVLMATVTGVNTTSRLVRTSVGAVPYDFLILATGATHSYFGHNNWGNFARGLKRIEDAIVIRRELLLAFERAEISTADEERRRLLTFIIIGAGPTGVEMAGAIAEVARHTLPPDFRRIDPKAARVILIEAGTRVLAAFPEKLATYGHHALEAMGVEVMTSTRVIAIDERGVDFDGGRIDACTIIWAAGVVASPAAEWLGSEHDRAGRVIVASDLSVPDIPNVFVIGDAAAAAGPRGGLVPGIAPAAKQMGQYVAKLIRAKIAGQSPIPPFCYRHQGDLATIGRRAAIVKLHRFELTGFLGWLFWTIAHVYFLIGVRNRIAVALTWLWDYVTFQRGARLITAADPSGLLETGSQESPPHTNASTTAANCPHLNRRRP